METGLTRVEKYSALQRLELCVEMFNSPLARESEELEIDKAVLPALIKANKDLGFAQDEAKLSHLFDGIALEIKKNVPNIRLSEIPIAINKGVLGDYGDYFGLSVVSVIKFLKLHYASEKRAEIAKQVKTKEPERQIPTLEEQKAQAKIDLIAGFEKYKSSRTLPFSAVYLYRFASEHFGLIDYTNEVKFECYYEAMQSILKAKETDTDLNARHENKRVAQFLRKCIDDTPDKIECARKTAKAVKENDLQYLLRNESERIALKRYFDNLIEMETEIKDLLNDEITT